MEPIGTLLSEQALLGYNKDSIATARGALYISLCIKFQVIGKWHQLGRRSVDELVLLGFEE